MVRPHVALVTTIAPVHIEYLGSLEAIADAKAEIFLGLEPGGTAVLNRDAPQFERLAQAAARAARASLSFGSRRRVRRPAARASSRATAARACAARVLGRELDFDLGAPGVHMAENALGALLAAEALGADLDACAAALAAFSPQKGRGERFALPTPDGAATLIDESYNANPASMRAALTLLGAAEPGPNGRRIAVIGDMLELGPDGAAMHAELAADLERQQRRSPVRRRPADARALSTRRPRAMRGRLGRAVERPRRDEVAAALARRRRRDGQGFERQPDGPAGRGFARSLRPPGRDEARRDADLADRLSHLPGVFHLFR